MVVSLLHTQYFKHALFFLNEANVDKHSLGKNSDM